MFDPTNLLGREGMTGVAAYLLGAWLTAGPIAERHAVLHLIDACKQGHVATLKAPRIKSFEESARDTTADVLEREGGEWGRIAANILRFKSNLDKKQAAHNAAAGAATCACRVRHALANPSVRWSWTITVATWRLAGDAPGQTLATASAINPEGLCVGSAS